jgi:glycosyltransferase involved in cell wall biosynthesis
MKKIGVDARPLSGRTTGIARYIRENLRELAHRKDFEFYLYSHLPLHPEHDFLLKNDNIKYVKIKSSILKNGLFLFHFVLPSILKENNVDIFWGTQQFVPFLLKKNDLKVVLTFHDMVSYLYPNLMRKKALIQYRLFQSRSVEKSNKIVCNSIQTKNEVMQKYQFPEVDMEISYPGIFPALINYKELSSIEKPYILTVSTIEPRKNYPFMKNVMDEFWNHIPNKQYSWVIAGNLGWERESWIEDFQIWRKDKPVIWVESPDDQTLALLYQNSSVFFLASIYEGFGIPVLEALQFGKNCLLSELSCFHEIADSGIVTIHLNESIFFWVKNLEKLIHAPQSIHLKKKFSWKEESLVYEKVFHELN